MIEPETLTQVARRETEPQWDARIKQGTRPSIAQQYVAYHRVSTQQQSRSGLGIEAQQEAVRQFLLRTSGRLVAELIECESGSNDDRPVFAEALRLCRVHRAILVIARLDRLSRSVALIAKLMDSGLDFVAADFPLANRLTIHVLAAVAEYEARLISDRIKAALAAAKARGAKQGGIRRADYRTYLVGGNAASNVARLRRAKARATDLAPLIRELRDSGMKLHAIAVELTRQHIEPPGKGMKWYPQSVRRAFLFAGEEPPLARAIKRNGRLVESAEFCGVRLPKTRQSPR